MEAICLVDLRPGTILYSIYWYLVPNKDYTEAFCSIPSGDHSETWNIHQTFRLNVDVVTSPCSLPPSDETFKPNHYCRLQLFSTNDPPVRNSQKEHEASMDISNDSAYIKLEDSSGQTTNKRLTINAPVSTENNTISEKSCTADKECSTPSKPKLTSFSVMNYIPLPDEENIGSISNYLPYNEDENDEKKNSVVSCSSGDCNGTTATSTSSTSISDLDYITVALSNVFYNCNDEKKECTYKEERTIREIGVLKKDSDSKRVHINTVNKAIECFGVSSKGNVIEKTVDDSTIKSKSKKNDLVIQHLPALSIRSELVTQSLPTLEIKCAESTVQTSSPPRNVCYEVIQHSSLVTIEEKDLKEHSEKINVKMCADIATTSNPKADPNLGVDTVIGTLTADPAGGSILKSYEALPKTKNIMDDDMLDTNSTIRDKIDVDVYQTYIASTRRDKRNVSIKEIASQKDVIVDNVDLTEIKVELEDFLKEIEESYSVATIYIEQKENSYEEENDQDKLPRKIIPDQVIGNLKQLSEISSTQIHELSESILSEDSETPINLKYYPDIFPSNYVLHCDKGTEILITKENKDAEIKVAYQNLEGCTLVKNETKLDRKQLPSKCEKQTEETISNNVNCREFKSNNYEIIQKEEEKKLQNSSVMNKDKIGYKESPQGILKLCVCGTEDKSNVCDKKYILVVDSRNLKNGDLLCACFDQPIRTRDVACCNFDALTSCGSKQVQTDDLPINVGSSGVNCKESENIQEMFSIKEICETDSPQKTVGDEKSIQNNYSSSACTVKINDEKETNCNTKTVMTEFNKAEPPLTVEAESQPGVSLNNLFLCDIDVILPSDRNNECEASFQTCTEQLLSFSNLECKSQPPQLNNENENKCAAFSKCTNQNVSNYECKSNSAQISVLKMNTMYCECSEEKELINIDLQGKSINHQPINKFNAKTENKEKTNVGIQTTKKCKREKRKCSKSTSTVECINPVLETDCTDISTNSEECLTSENISREKNKKPLLISQNIQVNITKTTNKTDENEPKFVQEIPKDPNKQIHKECMSNSYIEEMRSVKIQTSFKRNSTNSRKPLFDQKRVKSNVYNRDFCTCKSKQRCCRQIGIQKGPSCNWSQNTRTRKFIEDDTDTCSESISDLSSDLMSEGEVRKCASIGELYPCEFNCTSFYKKNPEKLLKQQTGDKNVCLLRERTVYDNWKSYYFSHQSRPSK